MPRAGASAPGPCESAGEAPDEALHRLGAYGDQGRFPGADACFERTLALPFHTRLTDAELDRVAGALRAFA